MKRKSSGIFITPRSARLYLFYAALLLALPGLAGKLYTGHSGDFLIESGTLPPSIFARSVIYLPHHNGFGAYGLIMNRPLEGERASALRADFPHIRQFFDGGPVAPYGPPVFMVPDAAAPAGFRLHSHESLKTSEEELLKSIATDPDLAKTIRVFQGHAGWGMLQLNWEMMRGVWAVVPAEEAGSLFEMPVDKMWGSFVDKAVDAKNSRLDAI